jgi:beta-glucanase (GH16 family)
MTVSIFVMVSLAMVQVWKVHRASRWVPTKPARGTSLEVKVIRSVRFSLSNDSKEDETYEFTHEVDYEQRPVSKFRLDGPGSAAGARY